MIIYKSLQRPVLVAGIPFKAFYALAFMSFGIFMGTLNVLVPLLALAMYFILKAMTHKDHLFFEILRRNWRYERYLK